MIRYNKHSLTYNNHTRLINIDISDGEYVGFMSGMDSGKTALAMSAAGLLEKKLDCGTYKNDAARISYCPTQPSWLFSGLKSATKDEILFQPDNVSQLWIAKIIDCLGLEKHTKSSPFLLSGGEQTRVALAISLAKQPNLLVIDDAVGWLDRSYRIALRELFGAQRQEGMTILETASRRLLTDECSQTLVATEGAIEGRSDTQLANIRIESSFKLPELPHELTPNNSILRLEKLTFAYPSTRFSIGPITIDLPKTGLYGLVGPNGSGKTTLFRLISGLRRPKNGVVSFSNQDIHNISDWSQRCSYLFQDSNDQLFASNMFDEIVTNNWSRKDTIFRWIDELINIFGIRQFINEDLLKLPHPLRRICALLSIISRDTEILLLDEPTASLDWKQCKFVGHLLKAIATRKLIICISHDDEFLNEYADDIIEMKQLLRT